MFITMDIEIQRRFLNLFIIISVSTPPASLYTFWCWVCAFRFVWYFLSFEKQKMPKYGVLNSEIHPSFSFEIFPVFSFPTFQQYLFSPIILNAVIFLFIIAVTRSWSCCRHNFKVWRGGHDIHLNSPPAKAAHCFLFVVIMPWLCPDIPLYPPVAKVKGATVERTPRDHRDPWVHLHSPPTFFQL